MGESSQWPAAFLGGFSSDFNAAPILRPIPGLVVPPRIADGMRCEGSGAARPRGVLRPQQIRPFALSLKLTKPGLGPSREQFGHPDLPLEDFFVVRVQHLDFACFAHVTTPRIDKFTFTNAPFWRQAKILS